MAGDGILRVNQFAEGNPALRYLECMSGRVGLQHGGREGQQRNEEE